MAAWSLIALLAVSGGATNDLMVLDFSAKWCGPCQEMRPVVKRLVQEGWVIREIDVDREPDLAERYEIKSLPTLVIMRDGQEIDRIVGVAAHQTLIQRLQMAASLASGGLSNSAFPGQSASSGSSPSSPPAPTIRGQNAVAAAGAFPMLSKIGESGMAAAGLATAEMGRSSAAFGAASSGASVSNAPASFRDSRGISGSGSAPQASTSPDPRSPDPRQAAMAATVRIRIDDQGTMNSGTGTVVDVHGDEALVLTCGHLFRDWKNGSQMSLDFFQNGRAVTVPGQVLHVSIPNYDPNPSKATPDIALIICKPGFPMAAVEVASQPEGVAVGQAVFSVGCDHGANPTIRESQVSYLNRFAGPANIETTGAPAVGRSGGGLFDSAGRLIGVCNCADNEDDEGIYAGVPTIHWQLKQVGIQPGKPAFNNIAGTSNAEASDNIRLASNSQVGNYNSTVSPERHPHEGWVPERGQSTATAGSTSGFQVGGTSSSYQSGSTADAANPSMAGPSASTPQITAIIRDPNQGEQVITITQPTPELLQMLKQAQVGSGAQYR